MKLILVRHGETIENIKDTILGSGHGTLSKEGVVQAEKLGERLKNETIDAIYSSDLKRAKDTAAAVIKFHHKSPVEYVKELRERDFREFEGKPVESIDWDNIQDKIESRESLRNRAKAILDRAYFQNPNGTVLFVGHNGINRALVAHIMGKSPEYMKEIEHFKNTAVSIFEIREDKKHRVNLLNCTEHLGNEADTLITCFTNPDIDGLACSFAYSELLNCSGRQVVYKIFGKPHAEADFVLDFLKTEIKSTQKPASHFGKIILVDSSLIRGLDKSIQLDRVIEVIDHRKVNDAEKFTEAKIQIELVGSCATLIAEKFFKMQVVPTNVTAVLLYSAIVSNTLNFKGNVTTDRDKKMAEWLLAQVEVPNDYISQMFAAKSDFSRDKLHLAIANDYVFNSLGAKGVGIAQIEMVGVQRLLNERKKEVIRELDSLESQYKTDINFLSIIDLENGCNYFIATDSASRNLLGKVLDIDFAGDIAHREGLIMRKEIAPLLKKELEK